MSVLTPLLKILMIYVIFFYLLFSDKNDARWIDAVPLKTWRGVFGVLARYTEPKDRERLKIILKVKGYCY